MMTVECLGRVWGPAGWFSRTSQYISRIAVKSLGRIVSRKSMGTGRIGVKSLGRVWRLAG